MRWTLREETNVPQKTRIISKQQGIGVSDTPYGEYVLKPMVQQGVYQIVETTETTEMEVEVPEKLLVGDKSVMGLCCNAEYSSAVFTRK